eukprot:874961_1
MGDSEEFNETIVPDISPIVFDYLYHPKIVITLQASRPLADDTMIDDEIARLKEFFEPQNKWESVSEWYISLIISKKDEDANYMYEVKVKVLISSYRKTISISFDIENFESLRHGGKEIMDFNISEIEGRLKDHKLEFHFERQESKYEQTDKTFELFVKSTEKSAIYFRNHEYQLNDPSFRGGFIGSFEPDSDADSDIMTCSFSVLFDSTDRSP